MWKGGFKTKSRRRPFGKKRPWVYKPGWIELDAEGFDAHFGDERVRVNWRDVRGIAAFKRDLFAIDEICVGFHVGEGRVYATINESMEGYECLMEEVKRRYPHDGVDWWHSVVLPPFSLCWTTLWGDAPEPADCPNCGADISGLESSQCSACGVALETVACRSCNGRGRYDGPSWKRIGALLAVAGAVLLVIDGLFNPSRAASSSLRIWGIILVGVAVLQAFLSIWDHPESCTACEGTGWWDPRGRAARKIPSSR